MRRLSLIWSVVSLAVVFVPSSAFACSCLMPKNPSPITAEEFAKRLEERGSAAVRVLIKGVRTNGTTADVDVIETYFGRTGVRLVTTRPRNCGVKFREGAEIDLVVSSDGSTHMCGNLIFTSQPTLIDELRRLRTVNEQPNS